MASQLHVNIVKLVDAPGVCRVGSLRTIPRIKQDRSQHVNPSQRRLLNPSVQQHGITVTVAALRSADEADIPSTSASLSQPGLEADRDLAGVLSLASDDELSELYEILHGSSVFSPLAKSLATSDAPQPTTRAAFIRRIERRFRFLAADAGGTLRGRWPSYREALLGIRERLEVGCSPALATSDIEAEIFLHLLKEHADAVDAAGDADDDDVAGPTMHTADTADGMASFATNRNRTRRQGSGSGNPLQRALAPLRFGVQDVLPALGKFGASVAVSRLYVKLAQHLGTNMAQRTFAYEAALSLTASMTSKGVVTQLQSRVAVSAARKGLATAASRYAAARAALGFLGPVIWASTFLDLARMSLGTDHARIVRAVFLLAQIRLTRTGGWSLPDE
jgi:uncharacterized protein YaaW (UPF0174 family)